MPGGCGRLWKKWRRSAVPRGGGVQRLTLTDEDKLARDLFIKWLREIGCEITVDEMGNIFGRRPGRDNALAPVMSGSHIDSRNIIPNRVHFTVDIRSWDDDLALRSWDLLCKDFEDIAAKHGCPIKIEKTWHVSHSPFDEKLVQRVLGRLRGGMQCVIALPPARGK